MVQYRRKGSLNKKRYMRKKGGNYTQTARKLATGLIKTAIPAYLMSTGRPVLSILAETYSDSILNKLNAVLGEEEKDELMEVIDETNIGGTLEDAEKLIQGSMNKYLNNSSLSKELYEKITKRPEMRVSMLENDEELYELHPIPDGVLVEIFKLYNLIHQTVNKLENMDGSTESIDDWSDKKIDKYADKYENSLQSMNKKLKTQMKKLSDVVDKNKL